jgi:peptidoglycan/xylan/chitin deacetylase (PgdA/CDA1 family)
VRRGRSLRAGTVLGVLLFLPTLLAAEVEFGGLDLAPDNRLLFNATVDLPDYGSYSTLFLADAGERRVTQLTFFPERTLVLNGELQIQNRFGVFRTRDGLQSMGPVEMFPSFVSGAQVETGRLLPIESSPDGRFLVFVRPTSIAFGDLVLYDTASARETVLARGSELTLDQPLSLWSPDSLWLVYASRGDLYYYSIDQHREGRVVDASYRRITRGRMATARWGSSATLYYISGDIVYRITSGEFFTKSLYSGILSLGEIVGKIPFSFDPNFDGFWVSPDGRKILLNKNGRNIFLYFLQGDDYSSGETRSLPYLYLPRNTLIRRVAWSADDVVTVLAENTVRGLARTSVFRLAIPESRDVTSFARVSDQDVRDLVLSPDGARIALVRPQGISVKDHRSWTTQRELAAADALSALWLGGGEMIVAGRWTVTRHNLETGASSLIALSQVDSHGFAPGAAAIAAAGGGSSWEMSLAPAAPEAPGSEPAVRAAPAAPALGRWIPSAAAGPRKPEVASAAYRVYLERSSRGSYRNLVMVRNIRDFGTLPLFPQERLEYEPFPAVEEPTANDVFNHGSRVRRRQVALVFDAVDSIEGLPFILDTLSRYDVTATFFVGGEAIRRYPGAVSEIAESGHEVGSLFFANFDMTDTRYRIDKEFIKLGLARTEDIYFAATGREISLLWHSPYYFTSTAIVEASREMNYTCVGRDVDSLDWVTRDDTTPARGLYLPASRLVERIIELKKPGSIVPILAGTPQGYREDYLFQRLDLLINALLARGYEVVPVSVLMESSR